MVRLPQYFELNQKENIKVLPDISFVHYRQSQHQHRNEVFLSRHLIAFVLEGEKVLHHNATDFKVRKEEGIFVRSGCYAMSEIVPEHGDFISILFFIDNALISEFIQQNKLYLSRKPTAASEPAFPLRVTQRLHHYLRTIKDSLFEGNRHNEHFTRLKSLELFYQLTMDEGNEAFIDFILSASEKRTDAFPAIMEQHFDRPLTLQEFAALTGRSLSTFKRDFEKHFQVAPGQWIRERRLQKAYHLLKFTDKNVTEVCYESGFENLSHFVQTFKNKYGMTPKAVSVNAVH